MKELIYNTSKVGGVKMDDLLRMLEQIYALLEQISTITTNQTTILLQSRETTDEDNRVLDMIESMVGYKDELIVELTNREQIFDKAYEKYKGKVIDPHYVKLFKSWVERIMSMKAAIVEAERNNVLVMQSFAKMKEKQMSIPKAPDAVAAAYKKQQVKT